MQNKIEEKEAKRLTMQSLQRCTDYGFKTYMYRFFRTNKLERNDNYEWFMVLSYENKADYCVYFPERHYVCHAHIPVSLLKNYETGQSLSYHTMGDYGRNLTVKEEETLLNLVSPEEQNTTAYKNVLAFFEGYKEKEQAVSNSERQSAIVKEEPVQEAPKEAKIIKQDAQFIAMQKALAEAGFTWVYTQDGECIIARSKRQLKHAIEKRRNLRMKQLLEVAQNGEVISLG